MEIAERELGPPKEDVERAASHFSIATSEVTPKMVEALPPRGTGLERGTARGSLSDGDVERIASAVVERAREDVGIDTLMLHSLPSLHGSPGIVVNEPRAKTTSCKCVEYKPGKKLCWSPGIIGALTDEQEELYCPTTEKVERPGTVSRMAKWQEAVDACKEEIALIPEEKGKERLVAWLSCMSRELTSRGVNPELQVESGINPELQVEEEVYRAILRRQRPQESMSQTIARLIRSLPELRVEEDLLTSTEHEILRLASEGLSNREIAERLGISIGTVRVHLMDIRRRIGVATREEAVAAFGEPTERERVPISILRGLGLPRPAKPPEIVLTQEEKVSLIAEFEEVMGRRPTGEEISTLFEEEIKKIRPSVIAAPERPAARPEEVERVRLQVQRYERKVGSLLTLVDELERSPSMETLGILEDELHDLVEEVGRARASSRGRAAVILTSLQRGLGNIIRRDIAPVRGGLILLEQETLPMRIEAAKRSFLSAIRVLRKSLTIISLS